MQPVLTLDRPNATSHVTPTGTFADQEHAARAYDSAAKQYYGGLSVLNFPTAVPLDPQAAFKFVTLPEIDDDSSLRVALLRPCPKDSNVAVAQVVQLAPALKELMPAPVRAGQFVPAMPMASTHFGPAS